MPQLMDPGRLRRAGAGRGSRGDAGRLHSVPRRAGRISGDSARRTHATSGCSPRRSWRTTRRSASASSTWRWSCCWRRWRGSAPRWSARGRAARELSRPVAELRRRALALGRGQPMPAHGEHPPLEFEPVFGAFERMAADIRSSQHALEEARRRTAAVLATVATGVVGVDPEGRVLIANRQAVELVGTELDEGAALLDRPRTRVERIHRRGAPLPAPIRTPRPPGSSRPTAAGSRFSWLRWAPRCSASSSPSTT